MDVTLEKLVEVWIVTERKNGAIYRTKNTGEMRWVPANTPDSDGDTLYVSPSTSYTGTTIRRKS